ncbi:MAG: hypothetical protein FJ356_03985 [Thaumarchaeota archaeon]|nr:hypothetical protein [Nitrososphaerota archaeon]
MATTPKLKYHKIFACPDCKKRFISLRALNEHYTKHHPEKKCKFVLWKGRGMAKSTRPPVKAIVIKRIKS